jgi:hypothetical protein
MPQHSVPKRCQRLGRGQRALHDRAAAGALGHADPRKLIPTRSRNVVCGADLDGEQRAAGGRAGPVRASRSRDLREDQVERVVDLDPALDADVGARRSGR